MCGYIKWTVKRDYVTVLWYVGVVSPQLIRIAGGEETFPFSNTNVCVSVAAIHVHQYLGSIE